MSSDILRKISKSSAIVTGATGIAFVFSLAALALNARALGSQQFGLLAVVQAYFAFIGGLATFDNWQPVVRMGLRSPERLGLILGSAMALDLLASAIATVVAMGGLLIFRESLGIGVQAALPVFVYGLSLLAGVAGTPKGYFRLQGRFDILASNQIAFNVLLLAASLLLWHYDATLDTYLIVFAFVAAFPALSILARMLLSARHDGVAIRNPFLTASGRRFFKRFLRIAAGNSVLSSLLTSRHQIALFIVSSSAGSSAAGLFAVAVRCANAFTRLVAPLNQVLFPELLRMASERDPAVLRRSMRRTALGLVFACVAVGALGSLASTLVVTLAGGRGYAAAADLFSLLLVAEVALWLGYYFNPIILHTAGQAPLLRTNVALMLLTCLASLGLAHVLGAVGVAYALVAGAVCTCAALYLLADRSVRRSALAQSMREAHV